MTSINFSLEPRDVAFVPIQLGHFLIPLLQTGAMLLRAASGWQRLVVAGNYCVYTIMKRNSSGTMPKTVLERKKKKIRRVALRIFWSKIGGGYKHKAFFSFYNRACMGIFMSFLSLSPFGSTADITTRPNIERQQPHPNPTRKGNGLI